MVEFETRIDYDPSNADIVIGVGNGLRNKKNLLTYIKPLAETISNHLGTKVGIGVSRKARNNGIITDSYFQIGHSGQTIRPKVYIAIGISGAIQHMMGVKDAVTIIAINKDPNARIFEDCDYGIVGKLEETIPQLIEQIKIMKSKDKTNQISSSFIKNFI